MLCLNASQSTDASSNLCKHQPCMAEATVDTLALLRAASAAAQMPGTVVEAMPWRLAAVTTLIALATWLMLSRLARRRRLDLDRIPGPWKHGWPLLGNVLSLIRVDVHRQLLQWADQYGGIYRAHMLWHCGVIVTDPTALAIICGRGEGACDKASIHYHAIDGMTSKTHEPNLLTSPADSTWYTIRKAVAQSFSWNNVKRKLPVILERVDAMVARLRELGPNVAVDMDNMALRVTLDVIGAAGFGHLYQSVEQPIPAPADHLLRILPRCFLECMLRVVNPMRRVSPLLAPLSKKGVFGWGQKGAQSFQYFQDKMSELLDVVSSRGPPQDDDNDLGAQLWRLVHEGKVSKERVLSEIGILFVEGFETTGHTISWTLLQVVTNPGIQDKVAAELESVGLLAAPGRTTRRLELEDLRSLKYLTACVKEAMRMFPVVSIMSRVTAGDTRVGPYMIPAGVAICIPLFAIQNTKHNWEAPAEFRPERWMDVPVETYVAGPGVIGGTVGGKGPDERTICFMPFSEGPRNCVGQTLAKLEVMVVLASILANFRLQLAPEMGGIEGVRRREGTLLTLQTWGSQGIGFNLTPRA